MKGDIRKAEKGISMPTIQRPSFIFSGPMATMMANSVISAPPNMTFEVRKQFIDVHSKIH